MATNLALTDDDFLKLGRGLPLRLQAHMKQARRGQGRQFRIVRFQRA
jgi:hypothetical protein